MRIGPIGGELVRIVHFSVQSNHVHLLAEAGHSADLSKGMASLNTGVGMRLNRLWNRTGHGSRFKERFHLEVISTPRQMRNALNCVPRNDDHHGVGLSKLPPCSSALSPGGWRELQGSNGVTQAAARCVSATPYTWLLKSGWQLVSGKRQLLLRHQAPRLAAPPSRRVLEA